MISMMVSFLSAIFDRQEENESLCGNGIEIFRVRVVCARASPEFKFEINNAPRPFLRKAQKTADDL